MLRDRILLLILVLAGVLRCIGLPGDLPYVFHFDEPTLINSAVWLVSEDRLNPRFFHYPSGMIYLLALCFRLVTWIGQWTGRFPSSADATAWLRSHTYPQPSDGDVLYFYPTIGVPELYLIGRGLSALASVLTTVLVYRLARELTRSIGLARLAALAWAISALALENAGLATTDSLATALLALALLAIVRVDRERPRSWVWAGALCGLAAGVKYNAGLVLLGLLWQGWEARRARGTARNLVLGGLAAVTAFLITTPYAVLDHARFQRHLAHEFRRVSQVTELFEGERAVEAHPIQKIGSTLFAHLGPIGILCAGIGLVIALRGGIPGRRALAIVVLGCLLPQLRWWSFYPRYLLPLWPALLVLVLLGADALSRRLRTPAQSLGLDTLARSRGESIALAVLCALAFLPSLVRDVQAVPARTIGDPRIEMTRWIDEQVPAGETVAIEPRGAFPRRDAGLETIDFLGRRSPDEWIARGVRWLGASARERAIRGKAGFESVEQNLASIRASSTVEWSRDEYTIYRLNDAPAWFSAVSESRATSNWTAARGLLEPIAAPDLRSLYAWRVLAEARANTGDTLAALAAWQSAVRLDPSDYESVLGLANLLMARGTPSEAVALLEPLLRKGGENALVLHNLAIAHLYEVRAALRANDLPSARSAFERAAARAQRAAELSPDEARFRATVDQVARLGQKWRLGS